MRPYSVSERQIRKSLEGWLSKYVVVDKRSMEVTDRTEDRAEAVKWCEWLNDADERAREDEYRKSLGTVAR